MRNKLVMKLLLSLTMIGLVIANPIKSEAKVSINAGSGMFIPSSGGDNGGIFKAGLDFAVGSHFIVGGYLRYKTLKTTFFDVENVGINSYGFIVESKYLLTKTKVQPYIGVGLGYAAYTYEEDVVKKGLLKKYGKPATPENSVATSIVVTGLFGVNFNVSSHLTLFTELKYEGDFAATELKNNSGNNNINFENLGGFSPMAGLRITF